MIRNQIQKKVDSKISLTIKNNHLFLRFQNQLEFLKYTLNKIHFPIILIVYSTSPYNIKPSTPKHKSFHEIQIKSKLYLEGTNTPTTKKCPIFSISILLYGAVLANKQSNKQTKHKQHNSQLHTIIIVKSIMEFSQYNKGMRKQRNKMVKSLISKKK